MLNVYFYYGLPFQNHKLPLWLALLMQHKVVTALIHHIEWLWCHH